MYQATLWQDQNEDSEREIQVKQLTHRQDDNGMQICKRTARQAAEQVDPLGRRRGGAQVRPPLLNKNLIKMKPLQLPVV